MSENNNFPIIKHCGIPWNMGTRAVEKLHPLARAVETSSVKVQAASR